MVYNAVSLLLLVGSALAKDSLLAKPKLNAQVVGKVNVDVMHLDGLNHTFGIEKNNFVWDGKPVQLQAGEMHYFRIPSMYWKDRILRAKAMGMNAIQTYVPWNFHEVDEGEYDFNSEMHDVVKFLQTAKELDMPVVLRPGPYICAEWTGGGLPGWLQSKPGLQLRTYEPQYIHSVGKWWGKLLPMIQPELAENGGAVIMVQLENEFGVLGDTIGNSNDRKYIEHLRDLAVKHLGPKVQLFTDDPAFGGYPLNEAMFKRGGIPGVFRAINLGPETINDDSAWAAAQALTRRMNVKGKSPFYIAETYAGWFTKWEEQRVTRKKTSELSKAMLRVKGQGASLGLYMVHGGTNFGFWAGANDGSFITSYDYNAPISEAGDHGFGIDNKDKYLALKEVFGAGRVLPEEPTLPAAQKIGSIQAEYATSLHQEMDGLCHKGWTATKGGPKPAEMHGHFLGLMAYRYESSTLDFADKNMEGKASDTAHMYINGKFLSQSTGSKKSVNLKQTIPKEAASGKSTLDVVVDTQGRANFAMERKQMYDTRGLWEAKLDGKGLNSGADGQWSVCNLRLDDASALKKVSGRRALKASNPGPSFFAAKLAVTDATKDTYLHPGEGFEKGVAFINGFNLGRYDMSSPQKELYVPASALKNGSNEILMLETSESALKNGKMGQIDFIEKRITKT